jgi:hypothetical protein
MNVPPVRHWITSSTNGSSTILRLIGGLTPAGGWRLAGVCRSASALVILCEHSARRMNTESYSSFHAAIAFCSSYVDQHSWRRRRDRGAASPLSSRVRSFGPPNGVERRTSLGVCGPEYNDLTRPVLVRRAPDEGVARQLYEPSSARCTARRCQTAEIRHALTHS